MFSGLPANVGSDANGIGAVFVFHTLPWFLGLRQAGIPASGAKLPLFGPVRRIVPALRAGFRSVILAQGFIQPQ